MVKSVAPCFGIERRPFSLDTSLDLSLLGEVGWANRIIGFKVVSSSITVPVNAALMQALKFPREEPSQVRLIQSLVH
jgi:hypothetical protein